MDATEKLEIGGSGGKTRIFAKTCKDPGFPFHSVSTFTRREGMLRSSAQSVVVETPVLSARYRGCPLLTARAFASAQHGPAFGSAAYRAGFQRDV